MQYYTQYPGARVDYPKNLTAILVDKNGETLAWGHQARKQWNQAMDRGETENLGYAYAFKMALKPEAKDGGMPTAGGFLDLADRDQVRRLVVAYLKEIYTVAVVEIRGAGYTEREIRWCITVPAIWEEKDKQLMRQAAVDAGLPDDEDRLLLSIEPEAAALFCYLRMAELADGSRGERIGLEIDGLRFMVVDCGGGTVDITAYETSSTSGENIALKEIGVATGGKLGSEYVNHAFRAEILPRRLGSEVMRRLRDEHAEELLALEEQWERWKTTAEVECGADGEVHFVDTVRLDLPAGVWDLLDTEARARLTAQAGGKPYRVIVGPEEVEALFDDGVVSRILEKIEEQLAEIRRGDEAGREPETLLLVGGFSMSTYLKERIRRRFGDRHRILVPPNPAMAVFEGALHYAYNPRVLLSRRSKYTYGFEIAEPWERGVDSPMRKIRGSEGEMLCVGRFKIAVRRGESVAVDEPFPFGVAPTSREQTAAQVRLFRTRKLDPRYVDEEGCEEIGAFDVDISDSVGRDVDERPIGLLLYFGRSNIQVEAVNLATMQKTEAAVDFERMN
ncbi:Hsp70 family protein [Microbispora sp. H10836]|uniref:Hsp70 family protein n=1 Tax=Microbispora sp. H10836 TaxID=2729106 RepID=UPI001475F44D|nr:hypothetical protein [Microbispora sp. H10836]